jgi:protein-tyrosine-phosphatase
MAAGWLRHLAGDAVEVRSAGSAPAETINPSAIEAMRAVGTDITDQTPKLLEFETAQDSDVIITMGCGSRDVPDWRNLAHRSAADLEAAGLNLLLRHRVTGIDADVHTVTAASHSYEYDKLIIATGAVPAVPPITREPGVASGIISGMFGGMRRKTSLTLDEDSIPLARSRAEAEGLDVGRWLDRAIRHEAARVDVDVIAEWEASLPPDDQAVLAALDSADRHDFDAA